MRSCSIVLAGMFGVVLALAGCSSRSSNKVVRVAAASSLSAAFKELGKEFKARTGITPEFNFGSSGLLAKQIEQGAPYFLFAAADKRFTDQVIAARRCDGSTARVYARGQIVVWTASGKPAPTTLSDLTKPEFKRIAIANPEHAPYGVAAKEVLEKSGLWPQLADRIILGESVLATMLYARDGNADAAFVALSLSAVTDGGTSLELDPSMYEPLDQDLVVCGSGAESDRARQLAEFISSREGREIMTRYGFAIPDDKARAQTPTTP